jgi:hypothetical protein
MKMMMMMMMLETIIFYSEMLCAMLIASFLCRIWNKSIEIDRERERKKKLGKQLCCFYIHFGTEELSATDKKYHKM